MSKEAGPFEKATPRHYDDLPEVTKSWVERKLKAQREIYERLFDPQDLTAK